MPIDVWEALLRPDDVNALVWLVRARLAELNEGYTDRVERLSAAFHRDTGMLAPGKDQSAAYGGYPSDEERREAWQLWCDQQRRRDIEAHRQALIAFG